jgi:hypothetical protein
MAFFVKQNKIRSENKSFGCINSSVIFVKI